MSELQTIVDKVIEFRDERDWRQFHNAKDLALALNVEAAELLELFLWKKSKYADKDKIKEELADVFIYAILLAEEQEVDIIEMIQNKLQINGKKYPIHQSKGSSKKYTDL